MATSMMFLRDARSIAQIYLMRRDAFLAALLSLALLRDTPFVRGQRKAQGFGVRAVTPDVPAAGWLGSAYFSKGGWATRVGSGLAVHAINPQIGTDASPEARLRLLRE